MIPMPDIFLKITTKITELLEAGVVPWRQPWSGTVPTNLATMRPYNGINFLLLGCLGYESSYWVTFKQANKLDGGIKAGEKSPAFVVYADTWTQKKQIPDGSEEIETRRFLKYTPVFNLTQCRGIQAPEAKQARSIEPLDACNAIIDGLKEEPSIEMGQMAAYLPTEDKIVMPDISHFREAEGYHASLFHELTHWTGAPQRLNRPITSYNANRKGYAREELIAEMGAAFLCARCHIDTATIENQTAYIDSWLKALRSDRRLVPEAAKAARIAVEYLEAGAIPASDPTLAAQAATF
jgi:antirestriction protein ArdC